jgi:8-oxo-dGTP diphosphatase
MTVSPILPSKSNDYSELVVQTTLCYVLDGDKVLLIMKKRGLGEGKWNAPGGKANSDENPTQAAIREVKEETGLTISNLKPLGFLEFIWPSFLAGKNNSRCYIFNTTDFSGELVETDECLPKWFLIKDVPYQEMWEDDIIWLPDVLGGKQVHWRFIFNDNNSIIGQEKLYD